MDLRDKSSARRWQQQGGRKACRDQSSAGAGEKPAGTMEEKAVMGEKAATRSLMDIAPPTLIVLKEPEEKAS